VAFRGDAAFAKPELYQALEEQDVKYAIRLPANDNLERNIAGLLTRPVGRPSYKPLVRYQSFLYQAASWKTARRVVAKVEFHFGELFPRVGFIVTTLAADNRAVVRFYNKRGTAEQWIKEGKQALKMTRLSWHFFRSNEVRLWLSVIAYNLGNLWRRLVLPVSLPRRRNLPRCALDLSGWRRQRRDPPQHAYEEPTRQMTLRRQQPGGREKCLRSRSEKWHFRALRGRETRNRPLPAPLEKPWTETGLKPCTGRPWHL
jgi:hypothetical protein